MTARDPAAEGERASDGATFLDLHRELTAEEQQDEAEAEAAVGKPEAAETPDGGAGG